MKWKGSKHRVHKNGMENGRMPGCAAAPLLCQGLSNSLTVGPRRGPRPASRAPSDLLWAANRLAVPHPSPAATSNAASSVLHVLLPADQRKLGALQLPAQVVGMLQVGARLEAVVLFKNLHLQRNIKQQRAVACRFR